MGRNSNKQVLQTQESEEEMTTLTIHNVNPDLLRAQYRTLLKIRYNNELVLDAADEKAIEHTDGLIEFLEEIFEQNNIPMLEK